MQIWKIWLFLGRFEANKPSCTTERCLKALSSSSSESPEIVFVDIDGDRAAKRRESTFDSFLATLFERGEQEGPKMVTDTCSVPVDCGQI
jgi:hypothetical protein